MVYLKPIFYSIHYLFSLMWNFLCLNNLYFSFMGLKYSFLDIFFMETFINLTYLLCYIFSMTALLIVKVIKFLNCHIVLSFIKIFMIMTEALHYYIIMMVLHYHTLLVYAHIVKDFVSYMINLVKFCFHFCSIMFIFLIQLIWILNFI